MSAAELGYVTEPERRLPVSGSYDVAVVGGGIAGVAAAVAAARHGAKTCLVEKEFGLGGLATLGNVIIYLPLCDGMGNQVIKGLGEELLKLSIVDGHAAVPACWAGQGTVEERAKQRYQVPFNPMSYMLALEGFLEANGVELLYDTRFCGVVKEGGNITALIVENKGGRSALACGAVVDASGDADVCWCSGEDTVSLDSNVRCGWFYHFDGEKVKLNCFSKPFSSLCERMPESGASFAGDRAGDVTTFVLESRKLIAAELAKLKAENPKVEPLFMPSIPTMRMTRRLKGAVELEESDDKRWFEDSLGMTGDWRKAGPVFYLPLRSLAGVKTGNLAAAGRCMSSGNTSWDVMRVIPTCAVTGEAAGAACAALVREHKKSLLELDIPHLQGALRERGALIDRAYSSK